MSVIDSLAKWFEEVAFTQQVHYLCIAHTEKGKLKGPFSSWSSNFEKQDAVKSAKLIGSFIGGAQRQGYENQGSILPSTVGVRGGENGPSLSFQQYTVIWPNGARESYKYAAYDSSLSCRDVVVDNVKPFDVGLQIGGLVRDIGEKCCPDYVEFEWGNCDSEGARDGCPTQCPLYRWPRTKTDGMAYQIVRVEKPMQKDCAPSKSEVLQSPCGPDLSELIF